MRYAAWATVLVTLAAALTGCGGSDDGDELTVLAAASLSDAFPELEEIFREEHPGVDVRLAFDSSATLAQQAVEGAPADVLATADQQTMETAAAGGAVAGRPTAFAGNRLVLVVPDDDDDNTARVRTLADLARSDVDFVVCAPSAPCGRIAAAALAEAGVEAPAASEETDVKAVLSKVMLGEADAGLVYATDAREAEEAVRTVEISTSPALRTRYYVAALRDAAAPGLAQEWLDLVLSDRGQRVLRDAGFTEP